MTATPPEAIVDSRNKGGTLTLAGTAFARQTTAVTLTPSADAVGERVETLSGATIEPDEKTSWALELGAIQDFDDREGFVEFARSRAGELVDFVWTPNSAGAPTYTGRVRVRAVAIGGEVNTRLTSSTSWPVSGDVDTDYPAL